MNLCAWIAGALVVALLGFVAYVELRDRANRGMRVSNGRVYRERVTKTIPGNWLETFNERDYK
jgi:hypothetical protein